MPKYRMRCKKCGLIQFQVGSMKEPPKIGICHSCGAETNRWYHQAGVQVSIFRPYVDDLVTGEPVEIRSRKERDTFLAENGVTLDKIGRMKRERKPLITEKDYATIVERAHNLSHEEVKASFKKARIPTEEGKVYND